MKKMTRIAVAFLFGACLATPLAAQEPAKPPKPASSASDALLGAWNYEGGKLVAMAEDFPADKYDFKPNPVQRSFAEQLLHVAGGNYGFTNAALGKKSAEEDFKRDQYKTKAEIVAVLKRSIEDGAAAIKAKGDTGLSSEVMCPWDNRLMRLSEVAYAYVVHAGEHYGQLVVYYRVNNMVPPDSRPH